MPDEWHGGWNAWARATHGLSRIPLALSHTSSTQSRISETPLLSATGVRKMGTVARIPSFTPRNAWAQPHSLCNAAKITKQCIVNRSIHCATVYTYICYCPYSLILPRISGTPLISAKSVRTMDAEAGKCLSFAPHNAWAQLHSPCNATSIQQTLCRKLQYAMYSKHANLLLPTFPTLPNTLQRAPLISAVSACMKGKVAGMHPSFAPRNVWTQPNSSCKLHTFTV